MVKKAKPFSSYSIADLENMRERAHANIAQKESESETAKSAREQLEKQKIEDAARKKRRARAKNDFAYFCKTYMPEAFTCDFAPYQMALSRIVATRTLAKLDKKLLEEVIDPLDHKYIKIPEARFDGVLDLEPRDHGKTTRNTQALPLWLALCYPEIYVVICGASSDAAVEMMSAIKEELEKNPLIIGDFGKQKVHGNKWAEDRIVLANGNAIRAAGRGEAIRGTKNKYTRPSHIICDDLIKDEEVENETIRNKAEKWFDKVVLNLGKGALIVVANTIFHKDDLPSRLLNRINEGLLPDWLGLRFSAITHDGYPLFPSRWSLADLNKKKIILRSAWWTEMMNKPRPGEDADFKEEWFQYFKPYDLDVRDLEIMMAIDPATGEKKGDYSFISIVARHRITLTDYVLFSNGWHESDLQFAKRIVEAYLDCCKRFKAPKKVLFEEVAFQKIYKKQVLRYAKQYGVRLPIKGFRGGNKRVRIKSLSSDIENGGIQFQRHQLLLINQFCEFPKGHDDGPDSIEMAISGFETKDFVGCATPRTVAKVASVATKLARFYTTARGSR